MTFSTRFYQSVFWEMSQKFVFREFKKTSFRSCFIGQAQGHLEQNYISKGNNRRRQEQFLWGMDIDISWLDWAYRSSTCDVMYRRQRRHLYYGGQI
jgi:hypothetical protein